jgi:hypothetical protein
MPVAPVTSVRRFRQVNVMRARAHSPRAQVPKNGLPADLDHGLGAVNGFLGKTRT